MKACGFDLLLPTWAMLDSTLWSLVYQGMSVYMVYETKVQGERTRVLEEVLENLSDNMCHNFCL